MCKAGYTCGEGLTINNPVGLPNGDVCKKGKFCPGALIHEMECPDGFYSDKAGLAVCTTCPSGHYCDNIEKLEPIKCITNSTCDLGVKRQPICPAGMWKANFTDALGTREVCSECPETMYCRAGVQIDQCAAGYLCDVGLNTVPNPSIGQCPEGHYCPKGAKYQIRCPYETMSVATAQR